jgi:hypothetical protein
VSPELWAFTGRTVLALIALGILLWLVGSLNWVSLGAFGRLSLLLGIIVGSGLVYALGLFLTGVRPRHLASP